jgi:hypothetical protein
MTKNVAKELGEKHTHAIRNGYLAYWGEDVKSDPSVIMYGSSRKEEQTVKEPEVSSTIPNKQNPPEDSNIAQLTLEPRWEEDEE